MASTFTALLDACVLYPFSLRDILVQLATTGLFRARWSAHIHEEWMRAVMEHTGATRERVERTRRLMDASTIDSVVTGYEDLIDAVVLPDPDDRHVLAAAIVAGANVIVTKNLRHFPSEAVAKYGIEALHPDDFLVHQANLDPVTVCASVRTTRLRLRKRPYSPDQYLELLERQELARFVGLLGPHTDKI